MPAQASLDARRGGEFGPGFAEQGGDFARIETVILAAELAADPCLAAAGFDRSRGLILAQRDDHRRHPFARAGAAEAQGLRPHGFGRFLVEQAMDQLVRSQRQQFVAAQGLEQCADPVPAVFVAFVAGQFLQHQTGRVAAVAGQQQAGRQLFGAAEIALEGFAEVVGIEFDQGRQAGFSETGVTAGRNDPCGTSGCGGSVGYNSHAAIVYWGHASANATDGVTLPADDDNVHGFPGAGSQGTNPRPSPRNPDMAPGIAFVNLRGQATEGGDSYLYHVRVEVTPSRDITGVVPELRKTGMRTEVWIERDSGTSAQLLAAMRNTTRPMNQLYPGYAARLADSAVVYDSVGATCGGGCPAGQECGSDNMCYRQSLKSVRLGFTGSQRTQDQQVDIGNFFASWLQ